MLLCSLGFVVASQLPAGSWIHDNALFLPLHMALEFLAISVGLMIFGLTWLQRSQRSNHDIWIGGLFLVVALLDFAHTLSYSGMPDWVTPSSAQKAITFWLFARAVLVVGLLWLFLMPRKPYHPRQSWGGDGGVVAHDAVHLWC